MKPSTYDRRSPLFSIVTVALNPGDALLRTAASVAAQTLRDYEHIVKDGGSSDGSLERLAPSPSLRVVSQPDRGIYDAMNQAIALCRGRFIQFLNAGDTLATPDVLAAVARGIERHPTCKLFYVENVNAANGLRSRLPEHASAFLLFRRPICHQGWFVDRACFGWVGDFDTHFGLAADHDFFVRAVVANGMIARRVPVLGVVYDGNGASAQLGNRRSIERDYREIRTRYFNRRERALYGLALGLTAPRARTWIASGPFAPLYVALVNSVRRVRR